MEVCFVSLFLLQKRKLFHLYKYQTPENHSVEFKETYSYLNLKHVKVLSTILLCVSSLIRIGSFFFYDDIIKIPGYWEYSASNTIQIIGALVFLILSTVALRGTGMTVSKRNLLTLVFSLFLLAVCYSVSYIFSMHNTKNNLSVLLIGIIAISIFFVFKLKHIAMASAFIILLFTTTSFNAALSTEQIFLNVCASGILAFVLFTCSRYGYYFKSEHFVQLKILNERNEEIHYLNQQKGEILGFVAHDLRNPLHNIESLCKLVLMEEGHPNKIELQLILNSAQHAKHIINDLVEVVQEEKPTLKVDQIDLTGLLKKICDIWKTKTPQQRAIRFHNDNEAIVANINPSKFTRVMDNLIGNGLKFSPPESPLDVNLSVHDNKVEIRIADQGIGIPEKLQSLLFDQFSKAGRMGLNGEKSIGLGLHISKEIIEQHNGTLTFESQEGKGTTFIITVPAA